MSNTKREYVSSDAEFCCRWVSSAIGSATPPSRGMKQRITAATTSKLTKANCSPQPHVMSLPRWRTISKSQVGFSLSIQRICLTYLHVYLLVLVLTVVCLSPAVPQSATRATGWALLTPQGTRNGIGCLETPYLEDRLSGPPMSPMTTTILTTAASCHLGDASTLQTRGVPALTTLSVSCTLCS